MKLVTTIILSSISLVAFTLIVSSFIVLNTFSDEIEKTVTSDITILTSNALDKINRIMNTRISDTEFLTSKLNLNLMGNHLSIKEKMDYLRDFEIQTQMYTSISIYDLNGIKIGDTRNLLIGKDESNESFFTEAIKGKTYHDSIPVYSKSLDISIIHFSGPLYGENGDINGVLVLRFSLSKISDILDEDGIYSKPIEVHLISNEGLILYASHPHPGVLTEVTKLKIMQNFFQSTDNEISFFALIDEGDEALFTAVKQEGFQQYAGDDWILVFDIPTDVLFSELNHARLHVLYIALTIFLISIGASVFLARSISKPLDDLVRLSKQVAKGKLGKRIAPKGHDEIVALSESFNFMIDSIRSQQELLEEKDELLQLKNLKLEAELLEKQKEMIISTRFSAIGELAARIAHDIRNPLSIIRTSNANLRITKDNPEAFEKALNRINRAIDRITHQVDDVMDFVKDSKLQLESTSLLELFNSIIGDMTISDEIKVHLPTNDITLQADKIKLISLFSNLIMNAVQAMDNKGVITIRISKKLNDSVNIEVENTGSSISDEIIGKIFDPLFTTKQIGTGLGLASCKKIVEQHHGTISVTNAPVIFKITLPIKG